MNVTDYFESGNPEYWLAQMEKSDWDAGALLCGWLRAGEFHERTGARSTVLLLCDGDALAAYCTYAERDDVPGTALTPWMGFVYTFPAYRGRRLAGALMDEALRRARADGHPWLHISTGHVGLYEKYGCEFAGTMPNASGEMSRIYRRRTA